MGLRLSHLRLVEAPGEWPVHVVGPGNSTWVTATAALKAMREDIQAASTIVSLSNGALRVCDYLASCGITLEDAPAAIVGALKGYLRAAKLVCSRKGKVPFYEVKGASAVVARTKTEFLGVRRLLQSAIDLGLYAHPHPMELSEDQLRELRLRSRQSGRRKEAARVALSSSLFRFGIVAYQPPRRTQVELVRDVVDRAIKAGWWSGRVIYLMLMADGGPRPSEPTRWTMLDWCKASRCGTAVESPSKGYGDERVKIVRSQPDTAQALRGFVDGDRRLARTGALDTAGYLEKFDRGEWEDLRAEPLLVDADGEALVYDRLARSFRRTIADGIVDPRTGRPPIARPTLHWIRHLFVYDHLTLIALAKLKPDEELRQKEILVAYMKWSLKSDMLATYGREFDEERVAVEMTASMQRRAAMSLAISSGDPKWTAPAPVSASDDGRIANMFRDRRADADALRPVFAARPAPRR
jgi:hypothetical protein